MSIQLLQFVVTVLAHASCAKSADLVFSSWTILTCCWRKRCNRMIALFSFRVYQAGISLF